MLSAFLNTVKPGQIYDYSNPEDDGKGCHTLQVVQVNRNVGVVTCECIENGVYGGWSVNLEAAEFEKHCKLLEDLPTQKTGILSNLPKFVPLLIVLAMVTLAICLFISFASEAAHGSEIFTYAPLRNSIEITVINPDLHYVRYVNNKPWVSVPETFWLDSLTFKLANNYFNEMLYSDLNLSPYFQLTYPAGHVFIDASDIKSLGPTYYRDFTYARDSNFHDLAAANLFHYVSNLPEPGGLELVAMVAISFFVGFFCCGLGLPRKYKPRTLRIKSLTCRNKGF